MSTAAVFSTLPSALASRAEPRKRPQNCSTRSPSVRHAGKDEPYPAHPRPYKTRQRDKPLDRPPFERRGASRSQMKGNNALSLTLRPLRNPFFRRTPRFLAQRKRLDRRHLGEVRIDKPGRPNKRSPHRIVLSEAERHCEKAGLRAVMQWHEADAYRDSCRPQKSRSRKRPLLQVEHGVVAAASKLAQASEDCARVQPSLLVRMDPKAGPEPHDLACAGTRQNPDFQFRMSMMQMLHEQPDHHGIAHPVHLDHEEPAGDAGKRGGITAGRAAGHAAQRPLADRRQTGPERPL